MTQELPAVAGDAIDARPEPAPAEPVELTPVAEAQRLDVLDVLRGFALIGILLMNIEWFNRAIAVLTMGDMGLRDLDHGAGFLVKVFVEGKFYKLFSLLFGMGFAVMLLRAEEAGRPFFAWFARRAGVLLAIGLAHSIFLWTGDILHDYAIGAFLLLGIAWLRTKPRFAFLRNPQSLLRISIGMMIVPILIMSAVGIGSAVTRDPTDMRERFVLSEAKRAELEKAWPKREAELLAEARKIAPGEVGERPDEDEEDAADAPATETAAKLAPLTGAAPQAVEAAGAKPSAREKKAASKQAAEDEKKSKGDAKAKAKDKLPAENWFKRREFQTKAIFWEEQAMTSPSYAVATRYRWGQTLESMAGAPFFALFLLLPIFLLGWWLVETGKMRNPEAHLNLFRAMVWVGWPFGLVFAMAAAILTYHPAWVEARGPDVVTQSLHWCGQMLLCAAYVGSFVLLLRKAFFKRLFGWLAPLGRMALTNYLTHSLVFSTLFYGYGAGWFGQVSRFPQMGLVLAMISLQVIGSRVWLAHFHYGPMEWLWRSATYLKWQPLRR
ncbi:MAG: DUF418 domain-containing protein [Xanthomonadales bacterium]|nr:DUF418 domain-containing protein [Xanthomonadales bacterium]MBK7146876.1 DUF418 domain-containing protein [Xanthomonadales bacterium]